MIYVGFQDLVCERTSRLLPRWGRVPASVNPLSVSLPASHGRSCSDSGGRTLSPEGLEEHKGQRLRGGSHTVKKRIMAIDDLLRAKQDKSNCRDNWGDFFFFFCANLHYWPGDDNRHIKCLIGLGRENVNVTGQIWRLNKRWSVRRVFLWGNTTPSCPLQAKWHNCFVGKNSVLLLHIKAKVNGQPPAQ